jgi:hypothetical protein
LKTRLFALWRARFAKTIQKSRLENARVRIVAGMVREDRIQKSRLENARVRIVAGKVREDRIQKSRLENARVRIVADGSRRHNSDLFESATAERADADEGRMRCA